MSVETIVEKAHAHGIEALALTDINNSTGVLDFVKQCRKANIKPIAGMEFRQSDKLLYIAIAKNNDGFHELNKFRTQHTLAETPLPETPPCMENVFTIYPFGKKTINELHENEFIGIQPHEVNRLYSTQYRTNHSKLVILQPTTFADSNGYILHQHLMAIHKNTLLGKLNPSDVALPSEHFFTYDQLLSFYEDCPQIIKNTEQIINDSTIEFDFNTNKNKQTYTGSRYDDKLLLFKLAKEGLVYRYGKTNKKAQERMLHELEIIDKLGFSAYFLITWDIISYSMARGIYHVGRGSGANSIVAYCLKITDVDPIELNLYFERFLNPKRTSSPDFDIDYSWKDRDSVQDYIFKRYGHEHTALLGAMSTFKDKSIYRELGKVYGLPKEDIDSLISQPNASTNQNDITRSIISVGKQLEDFPNVRSIHAGGVLISEKPITYYTALDLPPKGFPTTQWDMYIAEDIGFDKLDILSQRGIGHIFEAKEIVERNHGISLDIHQVEQFKTDEKVVSLMKRGEAIGCFYVESPAMRMLLKKLRCETYLSLVAASSIIRPGVAKSGMMKEYIKRFHKPEGFSYLHPIFKEQLSETFGIMVYQEDVLKICHHFADLDLDEADVLRRIMSGKPRFKNELENIVAKFYENCRKKSFPETLINEVWRQLSSFAGYSFSKAHSASYAVESFQSLYLKAHYPKEFMVAVINNFGGFYSSWVYFNEAKRWGAKINLPCINQSTYKTCIYDDQIYIGFIHISNFENQLACKIEEERNRYGIYSSLQDFVSRIACGIEQLILLIRTGAFRFTGKTKAQLMWEAHRILKKTKTPIQGKPLFGIEQKHEQLPELTQTSLEDAYDEIELIGFPVTLSFFDLLQTKFRGDIKASELNLHMGKTVRMIGQLATYKNVWTVKKEVMHFGTFIDSNGEFFDTVHFPPSVKQYPFRGGGVYLIKGKIVEEFGFPSIETEKMAKMPLHADPRFGK